MATEQLNRVKLLPCSILAWLCIYHKKQVFKQHFIDHLTTT
jgi:hypothetical protein